ncbi:class C sortase [Corynebacterium timonense]|uniref:Sortase A n=1 Tax=Corynebacterium timonense TaxID=441500 RepID=A0A1H1U0F3_9CORY|nr:class C sortase [Corynebacterium timonense]SDS65801.1 sortase A [Corynebacterium timonense]
MSTTFPSGRAGGRHRTAAVKQSALRRIVVPALLVVLGLIVMLYPVVASQWNNHVQRGVAQQYHDIMEEQKANEPEFIQRSLVDARVYNEEHTDGPILDPWLARVSKDNGEYQHYLSQLSGFPAMSQVTIPAINSKLPVYHGTDESTLQKGLGHLFGSALPIGGEGMHSVITGHTGITNATLWDNLIDVKEGDDVYVSTFGEQLKYKVYDIETVLPNETDSLKAQEGRDLLTLVTCTPYGINSHRLLVHAERVPFDQGDEDIVSATGGWTMQWWMWLVLAVALAVAVGLTWWIRRTLAGEKEKSDEQN